MFCIDSFYAIAILQNHPGDSFCAVAFYKTVLTTLFISLQFAKPSRRLLLCRRILQNCFDDSFHAVAICETVSRILFVVSHFATAILIFTLQSGIQHRELKDESHAYNDL